MVAAVLPSRSSSMRSAVVDGAQRLSLDMSTYLLLLVDFDMSGEWAFDNSPSCAHWVADRADIEVCTVREWLRVGHALRGVDEVARRFADGRLSYSKVKALTRLADADNQHELCAIAERVPASLLAEALARWLKDHTSADDLAKRHRAATRLSWRLDVDGMIVGSFRYPPEVFAILKALVDAQVARAVRGQRATAGESKSLRVNKWPSLAQQRADALIALITAGDSRFVTEIVLHVRGDGCTLDDGTPIADSVVERLASGAFLRALIHDAERRPINASSRRRHPTPRQKRVIHERDRRCVDCGATDLLRYDHEPAYEQTRHTVVEEVEIRCAPCHYKRHAEQKASRAAE